MSAPRPIAPAPAPSPSSASQAQRSPSAASTADLQAAAVLSSAAAASAPPPAAPSSRASSAGKEKEKPPKKPRRSKVAEACRFCRRSHMSCDAGRPCSRCVKRDIAHLCRDEPLPGAASQPSTAPHSPSQTPAPQLAQSPHHLVQQQQQPQPQLSGNVLGLESLGAVQQPRLSPALSPGTGQHPGVGQPTLSFGSQGGQNSAGAGAYGTSSAQQNGGLPMLSTNFNLAMLDLATSQDGFGGSLGLDMDLDMHSMGSSAGEFGGLGLSEFLQSLTDSPYLSNNQQQPQPQPEFANLPSNSEAGLSGDTPGAAGAQGGTGTGQGTGGGASAERSVPGSPVNKTERFLLTAADQKDGSRSDRLARVIHAKFEAGLLRPYNHVAGYTRLMRWMGDNMSPSSRQRTLHTLSEFRPAFRAIASGLTDLDLVFIEEAFERLLLDYDRVFSSMGIPSCLWRRTGEIYKGNKEFAALVGVPIEHLQGGKLAIYELMGEESAVNYWEKYGNIAFDAGQKAVLTSCVLVNQQVLSRNRKRKKAGVDGKSKQKAREEAMISCCFSFTIRRDSYAIPSMIVGNFLRF